ncbi:hypothetical protein MRB53_037693 [Persea americana]|nr:hypothetical protein MRB53_037693 [Persea americana]
MSGKPPRKGRGGSGHGGGSHGNRQGQVDLAHRPQGGAQDLEDNNKAISNEVDMETILDKVDVVTTIYKVVKVVEVRDSGLILVSNIDKMTLTYNSIAEHTAAEDAKLSEREDTLLDTITVKKTVEYPQRPAFGTQGIKLTVATNYFSINVGTDSVMSYNIKIENVNVAKDGKTNKEGKAAKPNDQTGGGNTGEVRGPGKELTRRIIQILIEDHLNARNIHAASDFASILITSESLSVFTYSITYRPDDENQPDDDAPAFRVTLNEGKPLNLSELTNRTVSKTPGPRLEETTELLQALNIIIGYGSRTDRSTLTVGRNTYVGDRSTDRMDLTSGLQAIRAFVFSARAATEHALINVQVKNLPIVMELPLTAIVNRYFRNAGQLANLQALAQLLRHVSVRVSHLERPGKSGRVVPRYKSISGLALTNDGQNLPHRPIVPANGAGPQMVQFWKKEINAYISVFAHFSIAWPHEQITNNYPVVNVGSAKEPSYLPMEVCTVRAGSVAKNKLTPDQTRAMLAFASDLKLSVNPGLLRVPARQLPAPQLLLDNKNRAKVANARWTLEDCKVHKSAPIRSYAWLFVQATMPWTDAEIGNHLANFQKNLSTIGIVIREGRSGFQRVVHTGNIAQTQNSIFESIKKLLPAKPSFLLVILDPSLSIDIYNSVKIMCDKRLGVICQCVRADKFKTKGMSYNVNLGLKINLKLGGANQAIAPSHFEKVNIKQTMFIGLDVTHPSPGSTSSAPSIASIVSSVDATLAQWPALIRKQRAREEIIQGLTEMVKVQINRWKQKNNGVTLQNIIVYRDGVSEGQYKLVLENELIAIQAAINSLFSAKDKPKLSIIIAGKRHHTRFYPINQTDADRNGNPKPGLVVDRGITNFCNWDFFLQAHGALLGTAKPAHYYVVYDEVFDKMDGTTAADELEKLTHGLCYLFGRATSAVSICPPAYYADLVCERARCYMPHLFAPSAGNAQTTPAIPADHLGGLNQIDQPLHSKTTRHTRADLVQQKAVTSTRHAADQTRTILFSISTSSKQQCTQLSPDDAYLSYYDVRLTREDVDSIRDDWLTDNAIAFWEEYLEHEKLPAFPKANIVLLRPSMSYLLMNTPDPLELKSALPEFKKTTHVFLPVNDNEKLELAEGGSHWSLLLVSIIDGVAFHYDSLSPSNLKHARKVADCISKLLGKPLKFVNLDDSPQQNNGSDCGVYVCLLMQHLLMSRLLKAHAGAKVSMSMGGKSVDAYGGRKEMIRIIDERRREGERRRSRSHSPYGQHRKGHSRDDSTPRIGEENEDLSSWEVVDKRRNSNH